MARPTLPTTDRLDPARLQIAYYERADRSGRFYLLIGRPGLAPSLVAAGLKSGSADQQSYGGCVVYVKDELLATGRAFADQAKATDERYRLLGARSISPRSGAVASSGRLPSAFDPLHPVGQENLALIWSLGRRLAAKSPADRMHDNGLPDLSDVTAVAVRPVVTSEPIATAPLIANGPNPLDALDAMITTIRGASGVVADPIADLRPELPEVSADGGATETAAARPRVLARGKAVDEMITRMVLEMLEKGVVPWRKPWSALGGPRNISGRPYRGINLFLLGMSPFSSPYWMTFRQAQERGGSVKPGERATPIVFYDRWEKQKKNETTGKDEIKRIPMIRTYAVFNLEQTEGVREPEAPVENEAAKTPIEAAEAIATPKSRILVREVLPNLATPLAVETTIRLAWSIAIIAALSFVGFGVQPPSPDWGLMINENRTGLVVQPWSVLAPAFLVAMLAVGVSLIGDGLARAVAGVDERVGQ